jgi:hypothetical protein
MIRIFSDETIDSIHRKGMEQLRSELSVHSQQTICQQMGWKKNRYRNFFAGKIDNQLKAIEVTKLRLLIRFNRSAVPGVKDVYLYRLLGNNSKQNKQS